MPVAVPLRKAQPTKFPPVRGMPPTPDLLAHPFADLEDDLPWDEPKGKKP